MLHTDPTWIKSSQHFIEVSSLLSDQMNFDLSQSTSLIHHSNRRPVTVIEQEIVVGASGLHKVTNRLPPLEVSYFDALQRETNTQQQSLMTCPVRMWIYFWLNVKIYPPLWAHVFSAGHHRLKGGAVVLSFMDEPARAVPQRHSDKHTVWRGLGFYIQNVSRPDDVRKRFKTFCGDDCASVFTAA